MEDKNWNPVEPYGKSRGGYVFDLHTKIDRLRLYQKLRTVLWPPEYDVYCVTPDDVQHRRDKRRSHNRLRKSAEDNA